MSTCTECWGDGVTMFNEVCPCQVPPKPKRRTLRQRIARWAYRTGRFDLAMRLSPATYWAEATATAERAIATGYDRGARELRGDD